MRFTVTGTTVCPICKETRTYRSELDAENQEEAVRRFQNTHCFCCRCSLFGISARLMFDTSIKVERNNNLRVHGISGSDLSCWALVMLDVLADLIPGGEHLLEPASCCTFLDQLTSVFSRTNPG